MQQEAAAQAAATSAAEAEAKQQITRRTHGRTKQLGSLFFLVMCFYCPLPDWPVSLRGLILVVDRRRLSVSIAVGRRLECSLDQVGPAAGRWSLVVAVGRWGVLELTGVRVRLRCEM